MTALLPTSFCLRCGYTLDAATSLGKVHDKPETDDFTLCMKCGALMRFNADLTVRLVDEAAIVARLPPRTRDLIARAKHAILTIRPSTPPETKH